MIKRTPEQLERNFKGVANHRRIEVLLLIAKYDGIYLNKIAEKLECNFKTLSEHARKLFQAGLINKRRMANGAVGHSLSPYGKKFVKFIESLSTPD